MVSEQYSCNIPICMVVTFVGVLFTSDLKLLGMVSLPQLLTGTVSSLEDHGYLVDIGVGGTRAFLSLKKAQEYIRQKNKGEVVCGRELQHTELYVNVYIPVPLG
jgi:hypothetical protein